MGFIHESEINTQVKRKESGPPYINPESEGNLKIANRIINYISSNEASFFDPDMLDEGTRKLYNSAVQEYRAANDKFVFRVPLSVIQGITNLVKRSPIDLENRNDIEVWVRKGILVIPRIVNRLEKVPQIKWDKDNTFEIPSDELDKFRKS